MIEEYRGVDADGREMWIPRPDLDEKIDAEIQEVAAVKGEMYEALRWLVHLVHNVGKAGGQPEPGEWEAAIKAGEAALAAVDRP